jgi:hypothetical protein
MNRDLLTAQLYAIQAQLNALLLALDQERVAEEPPPPSDPMACPNCGAPEEKQQETHTLDGRKRVMCLNCRVERTA